jgi:hypothetical protein
MEKKRQPGKTINYLADLRLPFIRETQSGDLIMFLRRNLIEKKREEKV